MQNFRRIYALAQNQFLGDFKNQYWMGQKVMNIKVMKLFTITGLNIGDGRKEQK